MISSASQRPFPSRPKRSSSTSPTWPASAGRTRSPANATTTPTWHHSSTVTFARRSQRSAAATNWPGSRRLPPTRLSGRCSSATARPTGPATPNTTKRDLALVVLIAGGHITPGQAARLNSEHVLWATGHPEHAAVIAVQRRRSATGLDLISLPDSLPIAICPTAALRALDHHQRGPVFRRPDGARLTRQAIVKILTKAIGTPATTSTLAGLTTRDIADASESLRTPAWSNIRARAVLVFLYGATLRGGELAALRWDDTRISPNGVEVTVRRAKNDPHGKGHTIGAPRKSDPIHCPAAIFDELHATYAAVLGRDPHPHEPLIAKLDTTTDGLLPISRERISEIVTTRAAAAGVKGRYTSHSPRAGSATDMLDNGAPMAQVIKHGRWQTEQSVHAYYRRTQIWGNLNPAQQLPDSAS